mmetsp:Transcript_19773/g.58851  ORF Transcript_19773/g.58851 Transcript_19773/m.58851 type:complete len:183 (-) Transcript_19773:326-874(-)
MVVVFPDARRGELPSAIAGRPRSFRSSKYARYAAVKAFMPHAAAALGFSAVTQDADIVWLADVIEYLQRVAPAGALVMTPDSPRVDPRGRPCKRKEHELLRQFLAPGLRPAADAAFARKGRYERAAARRLCSPDARRGGDHDLQVRPSRVPRAPLFRERERRVPVRAQKAARGRARGARGLV